jgi:hypothetical protein
MRLPRVSFCARVKSPRSWITRESSLGVAVAVQGSLCTLLDPRTPQKIEEQSLALDIDRREPLCDGSSTGSLSVMVRG